MHERSMRTSKLQRLQVIHACSLMGCANGKKNWSRKAGETSFEWEKAVEECYNARIITYGADKR